MIPKLSLYLLLALICAASPVRSVADIEPSQEMKDAMRKQAERARQGNKSVAEFQNDLSHSAEAGDPVAQFMLAALLMNDDRNRAVELLKSSAGKGCVGAAGILAVNFLSQESPDARLWLEQALKGGDAASMMLLASLYYRGEHGYQKSLADALAWAELAKARSHNQGVSLALGQFIDKLRSEASDDQIAQHAMLLQKLERKHPKRAFYLCGQSAP